MPNMMLRWLPVVTLACLLSRDGVISKPLVKRMNSLLDVLGSADLNASFQEDIETARGVETAMTAKCVMSCVDVKHYMNCSHGTYGECRACSVCDTGYRTGCGGVSAGTCGEQCEPHERVSDEDKICVPLLSLQLKADVFTNRYDAHYPTTQCNKTINRLAGGGGLNGSLAFEEDLSNYTIITEQCDMVNNFYDRGLPILLTHQAWHHMCSNYLDTLEDCEEENNCITPPPVTQALMITMLDTNQQPIDALTKMAHVSVCANTTESMVWEYFEGYQVKTIVVKIVTKYTADGLDLENTSDSVDMITGVQLLPPNLLYKGVPADDVGNQEDNLTVVEGRQGGSQAVKLNSDHHTVNRTTPEPWTVNLSDTAFGGQYSRSYVELWKPLVFLHAYVQVPPCQSDDDQKYSPKITFRVQKAFKELTSNVTIELPETECALVPIWYPIGAGVKLREDEIQDIYVDTLTGKGVTFADIRISVIPEAVTKRFRPESLETNYNSTTATRSKMQHDHYVVTPDISRSTDRAVLDTIMNTSGSSYSNDHFTDCPAVVLGKLLLHDHGHYGKRRGCLHVGGGKGAPSPHRLRLGTDMLELGALALGIIALPEEFLLLGTYELIALTGTVVALERNYASKLESVDVLEVVKSGVESMNISRVIDKIALLVPIEAEAAKAVLKLAEEAEDAKQEVKELHG